MWASHPPRKYTFLVTFTPRDVVVRDLNNYRAQAQKYGYEASGDQLGWATPIYVAETDEQARVEAKAGLETLFNDYMRMPGEMITPPGYTSFESTKAYLKMRQNFGVGEVFLSADDLISGGTAIAGSPKTVLQIIREMQDKTGFNIFVGMFQFGVLPDHLARRSLDLFAAEVMPHLR
jgi:alkanesulfonate monooxygenase SsuD/methylene tetrahydromethanopterin reductase-like flavin-dependent oxidoreductase (luciferase family)